VTFNTRPAIDGGELDAQGAVAKGALVDFDVTAAIGGNGTFCFAIQSPSTDGVDYGSREGSGPPQVLIATN
jgi:hypothetical protein